MGMSVSYCTFHSFNVCLFPFQFYLKLFSLFSKTSNLTSSEIDIVAGTIEWKSGTHYGVSDIIVHEQFNLSLLLNDIALLRVKTPIKFNEKIQPIKYTANIVPPRTKLKTTGWGLLKVHTHNYGCDFGKIIAFFLSNSLN